MKNVAIAELKKENAAALEAKEPTGTPKPIKEGVQVSQFLMICSICICYLLLAFLKTFVYCMRVSKVGYLYSTPTGLSKVRGV